ncbi:Regulating synaptic membrane exocytosis protein 4 [Vulpes lagopus]
MERSQSRLSLSASFEALAIYFPCMNSFDDEDAGERAARARPRGGGGPGSQGKRPPTRCAPGGGRPVLPVAGAARGRPHPRGQGLGLAVPPLRPPPGTPAAPRSPRARRWAPGGVRTSSPRSPEPLGAPPCPGSDPPPSPSLRGAHTWSPGASAASPWGSDAPPASPSLSCLHPEAPSPRPPPCAKAWSVPIWLPSPSPRGWGSGPLVPVRLGRPAGALAGCGLSSLPLPAGPGGRRWAAPTPHLRAPPPRPRPRNGPGSWVLLSLEQPFGWAEPGHRPAARTSRSRACAQPPSAGAQGAGKCREAGSLGPWDRAGGT